MLISDGVLSGARYVASQHCDERSDSDDISLLVIHNISLPPAQFGGPYIEHLFTAKLDPALHPYFEQIHKLRVSAHCLIRRDGEVVQFVPFHLRAWHAGVSSFQGRDKCNDYAIGIELEGTDHIAYTDEQYETLCQISASIVRSYPKIGLARIVGHQDIAPVRKTDPGESFDWARYRVKMQNLMKMNQES